MSVQEFWDPSNPKVPKSDQEWNAAFEIFPLSYGIGLVVQFLVIIGIVHAPFLHWNGKKAAMAYVASSVLNHALHDSPIDEVILMVEGIGACLFTALINAFAPSHAFARLNTRVQHEANLYQRLIFLIINTTNIPRFKENVGDKENILAGKHGYNHYDGDDGDNETERDQGDERDRAVYMDAECGCEEDLMNRKDDEDTIELLIKEAEANRNSMKKLDWPSCVELVRCFCFDVFLPRRTFVTCTGGLTDKIMSRM